MEDGGLKKHYLHKASSGIHYTDTIEEKRNLESCITTFILTWNKLVDGFRLLLPNSAGLIAWGSASECRGPYFDLKLWWNM